MNAETVLAHLRRFYLGFSGVIFAGSLLELAVINHTQQALQWTPFVLSLLGIALLGWVLYRPERTSLTALRIGMAAITLGSAVGVGVHVLDNLAFALEIDPNLTVGQQVLAALGGANPLMAPAILGMAAVLALAATYRHPALARSENRAAGRLPVRAVRE